MQAGAEAEAEAEPAAARRPPRAQKEPQEDINIDSGDDGCDVAEDEEGGQAGDHGIAVNP